MAVRKIVVLVIASFLVSLVSYYLFNRFLLNRLVGGAALAVNSLGAGLTVTVDGEVLGKTPFYSDSLKSGEVSVVLSSTESSFKTKVRMTDGALSVVNYSLGPSEDFSEGEIIWLEKSREASGSLVVISDPEAAEVRLDEALLGETPITSRKVGNGDHVLKMSKEGYKSRTIKVQIQSGYILNLKSRLLLLPLSAGAGRLEYSPEPRFQIWDFSSRQAVLYADTSAWAKGLVYYVSNLEREASPSGTYNFNLFLDYKGQTFDAGGIRTSAVNVPSEEASVKIAYLGRQADGGLSEDARSALETLSEKILPKIEKVQVLPTGLGYLNVRRGPSTSEAVITRVDEGDKLTLLGESGSYFKVKLPDGTEGYISQRYARKI